MKTQYFMFILVASVAIAGGIYLLRQQNQTYAKPPEETLADTSQQSTVAFVELHTANHSPKADVTVQTVEQKEHAALNVESNLSKRILFARKAHPRVFDEYHEFMQILREEIVKKERSYPCYLESRCWEFTKRGPESSVILVKGGIKWAGNPETEKHDSIERYTAEEVHEGKERNTAARIAVLDHFLNSSHDATPYEQTELIRFLITWTTATRHNELSESELLEILQSVAEDKSRNLAVRAEAICNLPVELRIDEGRLMLDILRSETIYDESQHGRIVRHAVEYLTKHPPVERELSALKQLASQAAWKRTSINKLLGGKDEEDPSRVGHAEDISIEKNQVGF